MSSNKIYKTLIFDNFEKKTNWNIRAEVEDNSLTVNAGNNATFKLIDFKKIKYFLIEFEFYNSGCYQAQIGFDGSDGYYFYQDIYNSSFRNTGNGNIDFGINLLEKTKVWHKVKIERRGMNGTFMFDNFIYDIPQGNRYGRFFVLKWANEYIRIRNFRVSVLNLCSLQRRNINNLISLILFVICDRFVN